MRMHAARAAHVHRPFSTHMSMEEVHQELIVCLLASASITASAAASLEIGVRRCNDSAAVVEVERVVMASVGGGTGASAAVFGQLADSLSRRSESDWLDAEDRLDDVAGIVNDDEDFEQDEKNKDSKHGGKAACVDEEDETGMDDRDEIAQIEDPLDCLEKNACACGAFWEEGEAL